jgi:aspartate 1-decarboxylase
LKYLGFIDSIGFIPITDFTIVISVNVTGVAEGSPDNSRNPLGSGRHRLSLREHMPAWCLGDGAAERRICLKGAVAACPRTGEGEQRICLKGAAAACPRAGEAERIRRICLKGAAAACPRTGEGEQRICLKGAAAPSFLGDGAVERRICLNGAAAACDGGGEQRIWPASDNDAPGICRFVDIFCCMGLTMMAAITTLSF